MRRQRVDDVPCLVPPALRGILRIADLQHELGAAGGGAAHRRDAQLLCWCGNHELPNGGRVLPVLQREAGGAAVGGAGGEDDGGVEGGG